MPDAGPRVRAPLLLLATAYWLGIVLTGGWMASAGAAARGAGCAVALALLLVAWGLAAPPFRRLAVGSSPFRRLTVGASPFPRLAVGAAALVAGAAIAGALAAPAPAASSSLAVVAGSLGADRLERPIRLEGKLAREPEDTGDRAVLRLAVERLFANREEWPVRGVASITVDGDRSRLDPLARGARVRVWARVSPPAPPSNPGERPFRGPVALFGSTKSGLLVTEVAPAPSWWAGVRAVRAAIRARIEAAGLDPAARGVVAAMLIGDRTLVTPQVERAFRDAGTLHVMAVSGLHVGIVSALLYWPLVAAGLRRRHALAALLLALPLYATLCAGRPSVVRAALMAAVVVFALRRGLLGDALNGLGLAAVVLLAWSPWNALDAGFQLSFAATLAIVAAMRMRDPAEAPWDRPPAWRRWAVATAVVTLSAQLATFPILAWHFGRVVVGGILVAAPATLLAGPVLGLGFAWLAFGSLPLVGDPLLGALDGAVKALIAVSAFGAELPFGAFGVARPGPGWLALWIGVGVAALVFRGRRRALLAGALALLALPVLPWAGRPDGMLRLTALDVGMGDALVLELPAGGAVLVDAGTAFAGWSAGEEIVAPFLFHAGIRRLEAALPTHGDLDHIGGIPGVLRDVPAAELWESAALAGDMRPAVRRTREAIPRIRRLAEGEEFTLGGARFEILLAGETILEPERAANERSVVLLVEYAGRRLLLTGDAGVEAETVLLERRPEALAADVLKVGHHGSRTATSPEFLAAVAPEVAIVSTREDRRWRLPDDAVLARLEASGARVLRTDEDGAVTVEIAPDGALRVRRFLDSR